MSNKQPIVNGKWLLILSIEANLRDLRFTTYFASKIIIKVKYNNTSDGLKFVL